MNPFAGWLLGCCRHAYFNKYPIQLSSPLFIPNVALSPIPEPPFFHGGDGEQWQTLTSSGTSHFMNALRPRTLPVGKIYVQFSYQRGFLMDRQGDGAEKYKNNIGATALWEGLPLLIL